MFKSFCQFIESYYRGFDARKQLYAKTKHFYKFIFAAAAAILYVKFFFLFFFCLAIDFFFFLIIPQPKEFYCTEDLFGSSEQIFVIFYCYY